MLNAKKMHDRWRQKDLQVRLRESDGPQPKIAREVQQILLSCDNYNEDGRVPLRTNKIKLVFV